MFWNLIDRHDCDLAPVPLHKQNLLSPVASSVCTSFHARAKWDAGDTFRLHYESLYSGVMESDTPENDVHSGL